MDRDRDEALEKAIQYGGGPAELARFITEHDEKITAQAICDWKRCPPRRVLIVEQATVPRNEDGTPKDEPPRVSRHQLRPDIYGADERIAA